MPSLPADGEVTILSAEERNASCAAASPLWSDDVQIFSGAVFTDDRRPIAIASDTLGGLYVAMNVVFRDTSSQIRVYRSTNGGRNWESIGAFYASSGKPVHSFDMCVTDTLGGRFLIGLVFAVQYDDTYWHGGKLYWCSMLSDGSNMRFSVIASADSTHLYGNASICTDGGKFAPSNTYHYVVSEFNGMRPSYSWRGLYFTHTTNWGKNWIEPDTSLTGILVETPDLAVDYNSMPESLCVAYHHQGTTSHHISVARNSIALTDPWSKTPMADDGDATEPCIALDPESGNAVVTYSANWGVRYLYSNDRFKTYVRDSIDLSGNPSGASVTCAPWAGGVMWRVTYYSHDNGGTIYYKSVQGEPSGFYSSPADAVNQFKPSNTSVVAVGQDRDIGGSIYRGNCAYVGYDGLNVYFDATDFPLDVAEQQNEPESFALLQNYPNPFNPSTTIQYTVSGTRGQGLGASEVRIVIYDVLGRKVTTLVNARQAPGSYEVSFDGSRLASGVYFYRLTAGEYSATKAMLLER